MSWALKYDSSTETGWQQTTAANFDSLHPHLLYLRRPLRPLARRHAQ
jgi:hypothetical protein